MTSQKPTTAVSPDGALSTSSRGATAAIDGARPRMPTRVQDERPQPGLDVGVDENHNDSLNYALLVALYTLQGIPMGLNASIPFLIQQKIRTLAQSTAQHMAESVSSAAINAATSSMSSRMAQESASERLSYNANAIFALCSWPFSLKLL